MSLTFYYLSGSPFAWRVWLALEYKQLDYQQVVLERETGELQSEAFLAINPHGKAPAIRHGGFSLYESNAIGEYLQDAFAGQGPSLWPSDTQLKAKGRQFVYEVDGLIYPPIRRMVEQFFLRRDLQVDVPIIEVALLQLQQNLALLAKQIRLPFVLGQQPSFADFSLYPLMAILYRADRLFPDFELLKSLSATSLDSINEWKAAVEALAFFDKTLPPHWRTHKSLQ